MKREFLQSLTMGDAPMPKEMVDAIMAEHGKDIQAHKQAAQQWEDKYNQTVTAHQQELARLAFDGIVKDAVNAQRGRNLTAIKALLDLPSLQESPQPTEAVQAAVQALKQEHGYLFETQPAMPPYAPGAGTGVAQAEPSPNTLAGALRAKLKGGL